MTAGTASGRPLVHEGDGRGGRRRGRRGRRGRGRRGGDGGRSTQQKLRASEVTSDDGDVKRSVRVEVLQYGNESELFSKI